MWEMPATLLYPLYGFGFPTGAIMGENWYDYFLLIFTRSCMPSLSYVFVSEIIGVVILITEIYTEGGSTLNPFKHGFSNLGKAIAYISEKRPLFFFGITGALFAIIGAVIGARVLYIAYITRSGVAVGSALVAVLFMVIGVINAIAGLILNALTRYVVSAIAEEKEKAAMMNDREVSRGSERGLVREIEEIMKRKREE